MNNPTDGLQAGQFFVSHWGYDQTNVDFYRVERVTAKMVLLQRWHTHTVNGRVIPGAIPTTHKPFRAKVHRPDWSGGYWVDLTSYSGASLWEGKPEYDTIKAGEAGH